MRSLALAILVLALPLLSAAEPSIPTQIEAVKKERAVQAESKKREAEAVKTLKELLDALNKQLAELDLAGPTPTPPVPVPPTDPLLLALRAAFAADPGTGKAEQLADLAELYKQAADLAMTSPTTGALVEAIRAAAKGLSIDGLVAVRRIIAAAIAEVFPEDVALTAESRAAARALFLKIHTALKGANGG